MNYLIIVYQGQRELARYSFSDQREQYNGALGVLKAHPAATEWHFMDANPKGRTS
jgi:hypothetical protein